MPDPEIIVRAATLADIPFADLISKQTEESAIARGSGISKRPPGLIIQKILEGKAVVAVTATGKWAGFAYMEIWSDGEFISNSGLIVHPDFRYLGVAAAIKNKVFELSRLRYPNAKVFSITTSLAMMKLNARLGFLPVTYSEITQETGFWDGCGSCVNFDVLKGKKRVNCLCTAMLFDPAEYTKPSVF